MSKPVEQAWRFSAGLVQAVQQGKSVVEGRAREFSSFSKQGLFGVHSTPSLRCAGASNPKLFSSFNPNQAWKLGFTVLTRASNASSREPEYWDTPETRPASGQDGLQAVQMREWDCDEEHQDLTRDRKVRKDGGHVKPGKDEDGVDWGQQHLRLREYETRQRASLSPNPPQFQKDDVYIPVKACYISRSVDLKRLSEEPYLEITTSRNNLIIRFANRPADAKPTSNRPGYAEISRSQERYMVAFQYGSIVFFNFGDDEEEEALSAAKHLG